MHAESAGEESWTGGVASIMDAKQLRLIHGSYSTHQLCVLSKIQLYGSSWVLFFRRNLLSNYRRPGLHRVQFSRRVLIHSR